MSLNSLISEAHKEIAGSRTKNRLTVQISYALQLIMEFYSIDFLVLMDYIEDVSVIIDPQNPTRIHLYQVKTKTSDRPYLLSTVISDRWFQKLYSNAQKYNDYLGSASVVCNTDIVDASENVFPNSKTMLDDAAIQKNIKKVRAAIATDQEVEESDIDLSKFYFVRSKLSTGGHKQEVEHQFEDFLLQQDADLQIATARSIYSVLYDELDKRFNQEISEDCTDVGEIFKSKGINGDYIKSIIACGLAIQIPELDKLFSEFQITSVSERRIYNQNYIRMKMDFYSNALLFMKAKKYLSSLIETVNSAGVDDMIGIFNAVYSQAVNDGNIPDPYKNEHYLKMLIMVLVYKYSYGGE